MNRILLFLFTLGALGAVALGLLSPSPPPHGPDLPALTNDRRQGQGEKIHPSESVGAKGFGPEEAVFRRKSSNALQERSRVSSSVEAKTRKLLPPERSKTRLTLRILSPTGSPLANTALSIWLRPSKRILSLAFGGRRGTREQGMRRKLSQAQLLRKDAHSGKDGRFALDIEAWEESVIEVLAQHERYAPTVRRKSFKTSEGAFDLGDLRLEPGGKVIGRVLSENGAPIVSAQLLFEPQLRGSWDPRKRAAQALPQHRTDQLGRFELRALPEGFFRFRIETEKYLPWRSQRYRIQKGNEISAGTIRLKLGGSLRGLIHDDRGRPIAGARIRAQPRAAQGPRQGPRQGPGRGRQAQRRTGKGRQQQSPGRPLVTQSDERGRFALQRLPELPLSIEVRHREHLTQRRTRIMASKTPFLEVQMERRLSLRGLVLDAKTGGPLASFGIRARRIGRPKPRPQEIARKRLEQQQKQAARRANALAAKAQREARAREAGAKRPQTKKSPQQIQAEQKRSEQRRQAQEKRRQQFLAQRQKAQQKRDLESRRREQERRYYQQRIGGSGIPPGKIPKAKAWPKGQFELAGLEPGRYLLDVGAPGYVSQAAGPFDLAKGRPLPQIRIRLEQGITLKGVVRNAKTGEALDGVRVELFLPPFQQSLAPKAPISPLLAAIRPQQNKGRRIRDSRTHSDGRFGFEGLRPGSYRLQLRRNDFDKLSIDPFALSRNLGEKELSLELLPGAEIYGKVHSAQELKRGMVQLVSTSGFRRRVGIDKDTGAYSAKGLESGSYFVRLIDQGRKAGQWATFAAAVSRPGADRPDLSVRAGSKHRFDLDASKLSTGAIHGRILIGNKAGRGLIIEARPHEDSLRHLGKNSPLRFVRRMLQQWSRTRSNSKGGYRIEPLLPGVYDLVVQRHTRRERRVLWTQEFSIQGTRPAKLDLSLQLGDLEITALRASDSKPAQLRITLVSSREAGDKPAREWRQMASLRSAQIRKGTARIRELPIGEYRYLVSGGGYRPSEGRSYVGASGGKLQLRVQARKRQPSKRTRPRGASGTRKKPTEGKPKKKKKG